MLIDVKLVGKASFSAKLTCDLCDEVINLRKEKRNWIASNFTTHLKRKHARDVGGKGKKSQKETSPSPSQPSIAECFASATPNQKSPRSVPQAAQGSSTSAVGTSSGSTPRIRICTMTGRTSATLSSGTQEERQVPQTVPGTSTSAASTSSGNKNAHEVTGRSSTPSGSTTGKPAGKRLFPQSNSSRRKNIQNDMSCKSNRIGYINKRASRTNYWINAPDMKNRAVRGEKL